MAQVRTVHQLRHHDAFTRVAGAVPRGAMIVVKAWLIPEMVQGVAAAREVTTGAQLPADQSRGEPAEPLWRAAAHEGHTLGKEVDRRSWMLRMVGTQLLFQSGCLLLWDGRARSTEAR